MMVNEPVFPMGSVKSGATGDGEERITSLEIAEIAGKPHNDVMKAIRKMESAWFKVCQGKFSQASYEVQQPNGGVASYPCYSLTKRESLYIATKFSDEARAKLVLRWEELETKHREQMKAEQPNLDAKDKMELGIYWTEGCKRLLNLSDVATLSLLKKFADPLGLPTPDYVSAPNGAKHSATELLKQHGVELSARKFNEMAVKAGLLVLKERKGTTKVHKYCEITEKGLPYGENDVSEKNANQVQPHWYDAKFGEVLEIIGYKKPEQTDMFAGGEAHK